MDDWLTAAQCAPAVLVTVAIVEGSVPREPGAKMLVTAHGFAGTIGGGHLEHRAIEIARAMLIDGGAPKLERFALGPSLGQCCGGIAHLVFEPIDRDQMALLDGRRNVDTWRVIPVGWAGQFRPMAGIAPTRSAAAGAVMQSDIHACAERVGGRAAHATWALFDADGVQLAGNPVPPFDRRLGTQVFTDVDGNRWLADAVLAPRAHLMLFGAGHVGAAIVRALADLPCRVTWVDEREDLFPAEVPTNVTIEATDIPEALVEQAAPGTSFLVMTHSHALDLRLSNAILSRPGRDWFGLIGSETKRRQFEHRLRERGIADERLAAMVCPIGLPGIEGKAPAVIAASVAAQLLTVWEALDHDAASHLHHSPESN
ncbi:xanthine dehydrogenase accessory protein XdhC [Massilia litorea]|uniref:Xanthine dehydrogenase accessory protein XdhC n=1 Tax=Massilia litorea TaxID=2769491 RepID=A0A7L9U4E1_9BURK|nr:xanthine dehydrogenase accessory protein XdhC [Massilia litorea]QOL49933.1 xanthine dehydrogenase accessory protein XdhC [Massilia litorea]